MKNILKVIALLGVSLALSACASPGQYGGPSRGVDLNIDGGMWGGRGAVSARSLTYKHETEKPLGTLIMDGNGSMDMTGPGVEIWARMKFCETAPNADECNGLCSP